MCVTDRHDMTLSVKVALNPKTTNEPMANDSISSSTKLLSRTDDENVRKGVFNFQYTVKYKYYS